MRKRKGLSVVRLRHSRVAQLYDTLIFEQNKDSITLNSGGFRTRHTKNCINDLLPDGFRLYQRDFEWYVVNQANEVIPFKDNMILEVE